MKFTSRFISSLGLSLSIILCANFMVRAQIAPLPQVSQYVPPSPNAASLGKYGELPVSLNTGTPNISIPIYTLQGRGLKLPITLSYHASGIKVDETASWVGLGWTLNAGGAITRQMRGLPDEWTFGYFNSYKWWKQSIEGFPTDNRNYGGDPIYTFWFQAAVGEIDLEPDIFNFNFAGYSGQIVINGETDKPVFVPHSDFKVQTPFEKGSDGWQITTPDGIVYVFSNNHSEESYCNNDRYISAWHLSAITNSKTGESISFTYSSYIDTDTYPAYKTTNTSVQPKEQYPNSEECIPLDYSAPFYNPIEETYELIYESRIRILKSIYFSSIGVEVKFNSLGDRKDFALGRGMDNTRLKSISVNDFNKNKRITFFELLNDTCFGEGNADNKKKRLMLAGLQEEGKPPYDFDYEKIKPEDVPEYDSDDVDHWGYFNREFNTSGIPALPPKYLNTHKNNGRTTADKEVDKHYVKSFLINKITYPTGGTTTFDFEPHYSEGWIDKIVREDTYISAMGIDSLSKDTMSNIEKRIKRSFIDFHADNFLPDMEKSLSVQYDTFSITDSRIDVHFDITMHQADYEIPEYYSVGYYKIDHRFLKESIDGAPYLLGLTWNNYNRIYLDTYQHLEKGEYILIAICSHPGIKIELKATSHQQKTVYEKSPIGGVRLRMMTDYDGINPSSKTTTEYIYWKDWPNISAPKHPTSSIRVFFDPRGKYFHKPKCGTHLNGTSYPTDSYGKRIFPKGSHVGYDQVAVVKNGKKEGAVIYKFLNQSNSYTRSQITEEIYLDKELDLLKPEKKIERSYKHYFHNTYPKLSFRISEVLYNTSMFWEPDVVAPSKRCRIDNRFTTEPTSFVALDSETVTNYYSNNGKQVIKTKYEYDGAKRNIHTQPTKITTTYPGGEQKKKFIQYTGDYHLNSCFDSVDVCEINRKNALYACKLKSIDCLQMKREEYNKRVQACMALDSATVKKYLKLPECIHKCDSIYEGYGETNLNYKSCIDECDPSSEARYYSLVRSCRKSAKEAIDILFSCEDEQRWCYKSAMLRCDTIYSSCLNSKLSSLNIDVKNIVQLQKRNMISNVVEEIELFKKPHNDYYSLTGASLNFYNPNGSVNKTLVHDPINKLINFPISHFNENSEFIWESTYSTNSKHVDFLYDSGSNISWMKVENEIPQALFWSGRYPVIKALNVESGVLDSIASSLGIHTFLSGISDLSKPENRIALKSFFNELCASSDLENALIEFYTYDPLIGMTSQTSPNGVTTYFIYDSFGRLIETRDDDYNILTRNQYHYKGQQN